MNVKTVAFAVAFAFAGISQAGAAGLGILSGNKSGGISIVVAPTVAPAIGVANGGGILNGVLNGNKTNVLTGTLGVLNGNSSGLGILSGNGNDFSKDSGKDAGHGKKRR